MKIRYLLISLFTIFFISCKTKINNPSIIEMVDMDYRFSTKAFDKFCDENDINSQNRFQWQNHWVIYTDELLVDGMAEKLSQEYPHLRVKVYKKPFYNFNREKITGEKPAEEWENHIWTANLVEDTLKQKEYLEYHRTQFEKWPEVSKGFCNADFQQVLVFRTGRQLMLVISIPKGKALDELNPKTTENNPRVNEWNKIMSQYQEGIEDAPKGTTWIAFKQIVNERFKN